VSTVEATPALERLSERIVAEFGDVQDDTAGVLEVNWRGNVTRRSGTYQDAIGVREAQMRGDVRTVTIDAPAADGYSDVYERGRRNANYEGRYAVKRAIEQADNEIGAGIDRAGRKIERGS
jgi:hypothetical protein